MLDWTLRHDGPTAIRYPKAAAEKCSRHTPCAETALGKAEVLHWGGDGVLIACGTLLGACVEAANRLAQDGIDLGVINARFVKPLDLETIRRAVAECPMVVTVEEGTLSGGFGSAVLEAASDAGLDNTRIRRLGIPDKFVEHGGRTELLADLGLDGPGIAQACRQWNKAATVGRAMA
jgi:1-deoxy-D-xylulose-5-phosphate synthase